MLVSARYVKDSGGLVDLSTVKTVLDVFTESEVNQSDYLQVSARGGIVYYRYGESTIPDTNTAHQILANEEMVFSGRPQIRDILLWDGAGSGQAFMTLMKL